MALRSKRIIAVGALTFCLQAYAYYPTAALPLPKDSPFHCCQALTLPTTKVDDSVTSKLVQRGEYLARVANCVACHSEPGGEAFAGRAKLPLADGTSIAVPALTSARVQQWQPQVFAQAVRNGYLDSGRVLRAPFPQSAFQYLTDHDLAALHAYLKALPQRPSQDQLHPSWYQSLWHKLWRNKQPAVLAYVSERSQAWNRGAYLVNAVAHCGTCHSDPNAKQSLTGRELFNSWVPDITADGLRRSESYAIRELFKTHQVDEQAFAQLLGKLQHASLKAMHDNDRLAVVKYLLSQHNNDVTIPKSHHEYRTGRATYHQHCASCHQQHKELQLKASDAWFARLQQRHISGLYRNTLYGLAGMPKKGGCPSCTERELELATQYILQRALTAKQKEQARQLPALAEPTPAQGKLVYQQTCATCHDSGAFGAPALTNYKYWQTVKLKKTFDEMIRETMQGDARKPPRGGCKYCSTQEVIAAINYMLTQSKEK